MLIWSGIDVCSYAKRAPLHWHEVHAYNVSSTLQYINLRVIIVVHAQVL